ncbi:MAG: SDR family NAD(P)-dependent oxidoreductase [Ekhidna sp.]|nr:SDR family NAD(P)-dependent oxidoreductase [Ekhidna sp.]
MESITIIGSGEGISKAVALKFGKEGFRINLISRTEAKLKQIVKDLEKEGIEADYVAADASSKELLGKALIQFKERHGHSSMILYNAAALDIKEFVEQDWESYQATFNTNVGGAFHLLKLVLPFCLENNTGKLFFTNGGLALSGHPSWTTLSVGKAGLRNLIQSAQASVKDTDVHIAQVTVGGFVSPEAEIHNPDNIANQYWNLYNQKPAEFQQEIIL